MTFYLQPTNFTGVAKNCSDSPKKGDSQDISNVCKLLQHNIEGDKLHENYNATAERHWPHCVYCISPMRNCFRNGKDFGLFTMFTTFYFFHLFQFQNYILINCG